MIYLEELKKLESDGIDINVEGKSEIVYFSLALFIGDNLAVHKAFGFAEGFKANYPCRFCKIHYRDLNSITTENIDLLRTEQNYNQDVRKKNLSNTGVARECMFNKLKSFHYTKNISSDTLHDEFCGTARYNVFLVLNHVIAHTL